MLLLEMRKCQLSYRLSFNCFVFFQSFLFSFPFQKSENMLAQHRTTGRPEISVSSLTHPVWRIWIHLQKSFWLTQESLWTNPASSPQCPPACPTSPRSTDFWPAVQNQHEGAMTQQILEGKGRKAIWRASSPSISFQTKKWNSTKQNTKDAQTRWLPETAIRHRFWPEIRFPEVGCCQDQNQKFTFLRPEDAKRAACSLRQIN